MNDRGRDFRGMPVLPADALPCIWMEAGLLAYRLCDRGYECEGCPLDAALRNQARAGREKNGVQVAVEEWDFPDDRRYHPAHLWVAELRDGRLRCGLDAFAARLLEQATSVVFPAVSSRLRCGGVGCWLADEGVTIPLLSPVTGTVHRCNPVLRKTPDLAVRSPYDRGWLMEVRGEDDAASRARLLSAARARQLAALQFENLHKRAARHLAAVRDGVGPTLADGGQRMTGLRRILGKNRYYRLVLPLMR